jgi:SAM-dependent methyltransferase
MKNSTFHFDKLADIYDKERPGYPKVLYEFISKLNLINENSEVLELGAGSGIASIEIYNHFHPKLTCLEPGVNFCNILTDKFLNMPDVSIVNEKFEDYHTTKQFDVIISATSFSHLDISIKYKKIYNLLSPNGLLIVYGNYYLPKDENVRKIIHIHGGGDNKKHNKFFDIKEFIKATAFKLGRFDCLIPNLNGQRKEIINSGYFKLFKYKTYKNIFSKSVYDYIMLEKTFLRNRDKKEDYYNKLFNEISKNGNKIELLIGTSLYIAKKYVSSKFPEKNKKNNNFHVGH